MILRFMSSAATTPAVSLGPEQSTLTRSAMKDRGKNIRETVCLFSFFSLLSLGISCLFLNRIFF